MYEYAYCTIFCTDDSVTDVNGILAVRYLNRCLPLISPVSSKLFTLHGKVDACIVKYQSVPTTFQQITFRYTESFP
jgi:hypothetical protein